MVMAQSLFIILKRQYPDAIIDVIAPTWSVPLLKRMPEVNNAIELPVTHKQLKLFTRYRLGKSLRENHYDLALITPRSFKSALIPFFAKARIRRGYRGEMRYGLLNDIRKLDKSVLRQTVQRYAALGLESTNVDKFDVPFPRLSVNEQNQRDVVEKLGLKTNKPVIGFMPGAEYGPAKQWPAGYYRELALNISKQGMQVWIFGSAKETPVGDSIAENNNDCYNLCGKTELVDVVDLIALCDSVVTNDSGLMHVACATGRKVVAIYGSSDPEYTPPLSTSAKIIYKALECSPCFERHCRYQHTNCLTQIKPAEVLSLVCQD